jgi:hypothetical protein
MVPRRLYIPISGDEWERLQQLAWGDRRTPAELATYLLARAIATYEQHRPPTADDPFPHLIAPTPAGRERKRVPA